MYVTHTALLSISIKAFAYAGAGVALAASIFHFREFY